MIWLKKELCELQQIDEKIKNKLADVKNAPDGIQNDINIIKAIKNNIYEKASKTLVYNLKRLIQIEDTQKNLAKKIGVSEDLLSKYKSGDAFPSIETLIYICEVYNIDISKLINTPFTALDIEKLENSKEMDSSIFEDKYYVYFLVTNISKEGAVQEGVVEIYNNSATFKILSCENIVKCFTGHFNVTDKLIFFSLQSSSDGNAYINMTKPNINKNKYVGGLAMMMLPSDANSKPCVQKILFSKIRLNRELYYNNLKELLSFSVEGISFGNIKIDKTEDEAAYNFIEKLL